INIGPSDPGLIAHLFEYDTLMGKYPGAVSMENNNLVIDGYSIPIIAEADPVKLPWKKFGIDWVVESSGRFRTREASFKHIEAGATKVLVSAPMNGEDITVIPGVNDSSYDPKKDVIVSLGSCTSNALLPIIKVLHERLEIKRGFMTTIHSYTNDQVLLDVEKNDPRRARAAALNIIPTTTGVTKVIGKVFPELGSKIFGRSVRVPVAKVSLIDLVVETVKESTRDMVNGFFKEEEKDSLIGILSVTDKELVSSDFSGNSFSVVVDAPLTQVDGNLIKVFGWYDNEWAYSVRMKNFLEQRG
ncbi:type I glyceraldehyde-3-phosphate dehydrogenase, partial [bacterium]|nr:type I glyceraldehyde-3-phosphate dehydrogenase [bacterium]